MNNEFARLLRDQHQVGHFLNSVLKIDPKEFKDIAYRIITCETGIIDGLENPTSRSAKFRDPRYQNDKERLALRERIVKELFEMPLLDRDDKLRLGKGGARPIEVKSERKAFIIIGLPASGKSAVAFRFANEFGAMILDADFSKRKLPEFAKYPWGASIVHKEASEMIFSRDKTGFESLFYKATRANYNLVIPKIGASHVKVLWICNLLKEMKYEVHLTLVYLSREKATLRALTRYKNTDRYVPLARIFDVYSQNPCLTYFFLKNKKGDRFDSFGVINTDVPVGEQPKCSDFLGDSPAKKYEIDLDLII
ncbi:Zeta toxin [Chryseolinea serpens]|uniref:Zeta toxin n=1 Tax=Chryseolinea serpens TaxID=947013 RepID=A0A1M5VRL5_9BACT|nr:zeta toxin family protein [Chryseolinea serpens]SHH77818.1 Zeta toxin [Chryseolinea serpens]